jgi:hypothetical protein
LRRKPVPVGLYAEEEGEDWEGWFG